LIASHETRRQAEIPEHLVVPSQYEHITRGQAYVRFGLLALAIVLLGIWLAWLGDQVAEATGLGESFIGALLLAAATSLPEVIASLEAVRLKALDLAVSNIFGSNIFNLAILASYDLVYLPGNLWFSMNAVYAFTAIVTMIMTTVAVVGIIYRTDRRSRFYLSWVGIAIIGLYLLGMYVIYRA
jgi:cation:H+ antiporter